MGKEVTGSGHRVDLQKENVDDIGVVDGVGAHAPLNALLDDQRRALTRDAVGDERAVRKGEEDAMLLGPGPSKRVLGVVSWLREEDGLGRTRSARGEEQPYVPKRIEVAIWKEWNRMQCNAMGADEVHSHGRPLPPGDGARSLLQHRPAHHPPLWPRQAPLVPAAV